MIYLIGAANPLPVTGADGTGAEALATDRRVTKYYRTEVHAQRAAQALAKKYPGEVFAVFKASSLYEAKQPEIMEKVLNESGEIVPKA